MCSIQSNPFLDRIESFNDMVHSPTVTANCQDIIDTLNRDAKAFRALLAEFETHGYGTTLYNESADLWTVILADMSEPGRFRHQVFNQRGFHGHYTMDTIEEVIEDAIDQGFRILDNGRLEAFCITREWDAGTKVCGLMQQLNSGQISWGEFTEQTKAVA